MNETRKETMMTMNALIANVLAGAMTPTDAARQAHPYALANFSPSSPDEARGYAMIVRASRDARPVAIAAPTANATEPTIRCSRCGADGRLGAYPFSTLSSSGLCDDCL